MALTKRLYKNHKVVITAENLNEIQDAIIELERVVGIVPGEGESVWNVTIINPNSNYTLAETVALPDGLYWVLNPITFTSEDQTETFTISELVAKYGYAWQVYASGRSCVTDAAGVLQAWAYTALPEVTSDDEKKLLAVMDGEARWASIDEIIPDGDEVAY